MEALEKLRQKGTIKSVGVSNFTPQGIEEAGRYSKIDVVQPPYNMLWREAEAELLPYCRQHNIGVMPYSGLAQGLRPGPCRARRQFVEGDQRRTTVLFQPGIYEKALDAVDALRSIAAKYGKTVPQLAIQWLTSRPGITRRCSAPAPSANSRKTSVPSAGASRTMISPASTR